LRADLVYRFGGRISAMLRRTVIPGQLGSPQRLGPLDLPAEALIPKGDTSTEYDWRQREERTQLSAINQILAHGRETQ
jgi:hypothetical protein